MPGSIFLLGQGDILVSQTPREFHASYFLGQYVPLVNMGKS